MFMPIASTWLTPRMNSRLSDEDAARRLRVCSDCFRASRAPGDALNGIPHLRSTRVGPIGAPTWRTIPNAPSLARRLIESLCSMRIALNAKGEQVRLKPREQAPGAAPTKWAAPIGWPPTCSTPHSICQEVRQSRVALRHQRTLWQFEMPRGLPWARSQGKRNRTNSLPHLQPRWRSQWPY